MKYLIDHTQKYNFGLIDTFENGKTSIYGQTPKEYAEKHDVALSDIEIAGKERMEQIKEDYKKGYIQGFKEISEERYDKMLGVLPPMNFNRGYFQLSEALTLDLRATFIQKGGKFYEATLPTGTKRENLKYIQGIK